MYYKVLSMDTKHQPLEALLDIRRMMERSSRFISLSGWSGIAAGLCALIGAKLADTKIKAYEAARSAGGDGLRSGRLLDFSSSRLLQDLLWIAAGTFISALVLAFLFTYIRSRKHAVPIWDHVTQRLLWNTLLPMLVGGFFLFRALQLQYYDILAPGCLLFYGLALVNGSKYTLGEVRFLGYGQIVLGLISLWVMHNGLLFWAAGFGLLHIVYGALMWWKYERAAQQPSEQ